MRFSVRHETRYRYARPIPLGGHRLRFKPRGDNVRLIAYALTIDPPPVSRMEIEDAFGNSVTRVWFAGSTNRLFIESRFELETDLPASVAALKFARLPWSEEPRDALAPYRSHAADDPVVIAFAAKLAAEAGGDPLDFLGRLNARLFVDFEHRIRTDGAAMTPAQTLAAGAGACRDVTVLFMAACRSLGLPARIRQRLPGALRDARRQASPARLAGSLPAGPRLARLRSDSWRPGHRRSCRAQRRAGAVRDHDGRGRLLRRQHGFDAGVQRHDRCGMKAG